MGLARRREGMLGLCFGCCQGGAWRRVCLGRPCDAEGRAGGQGWPPGSGGGANTSPASHPSERREMGTEPAKLPFPPPPCFHLAAETCHGEGRDKGTGNRAPLMNKPFRSGSTHPQHA